MSDKYQRRQGRLRPESIEIAAQTAKCVKGKKHRVFSVFPVFANDRAIPKTGEMFLEDSSRNGTSNEISARFQSGIQERYQKGLAGSKLGEITCRFYFDPFPQFLYS
jgi:hypothetical protein